MFKFCKYHDKRHVFAKPHTPPDSYPAVTQLEEAMNYVTKRPAPLPIKNEFNKPIKYKRPAGTGVTPAKKTYVHEHEYRRHDDSDFLTPLAVGMAISSDPTPSWSGDGGSFSGGGASDSWSSDSSSDSGSSFDSSSSSGGDF